jgi:hypothetical protein
MTSLREFSLAGARALVQAQALLDEQARASMVRWEEDGLPPTAWNWARYRLAFPVTFVCQGRASAYTTTALAIAPANDAPGRVVLSFRYSPADLAAGDQ